MKENDLGLDYKKKLCKVISIYIGDMKFDCLDPDKGKTLTEKN